MRHTGYPGGQRTLTAKYCNQNPALLVESSKGMLPKTKLVLNFRNLNVVVGSEHKQGAQNQNS
jgi:large subunit ribosomal protein L13